MTEPAVPDFNERAWLHYGDVSPRQKTIRVIEHYGAEWWSAGTMIKFVATDPRVAEDVARGLDDGDELYLRQEYGPHRRYTVIFE